MSVLRRRSWEALRKRNEDARAAYRDAAGPWRGAALCLWPVLFPDCL